MDTAGSTGSPRRYAIFETSPTRLFAAWMSLLLGVIVAAALVMRRHDARGVGALAFLDPVMSFGARAGGFVVAHVWPLILLVTVCVVFTSAATLQVFRKSLRGGEIAVLAVVSLALLCQVALLDGRVATGIALLGAAAAVVATARQIPDRALSRSSFAWRDVAVLAVLTAAAAILRLYQLNRITDAFEGELSPYYLAATRLGGIPLGNAGAHGPWAPLGYLFFVPIFASIKIFGPTVLAIRFSSAAVGLFTLSLLYLFALTAYGRSAAVLAGVFYILDPLQIGWGRTDVHPHGVTAWPALLIALVCLRAFADGRLRWFALLAALMALSWHQYPSGQTAVFIPVFVLAITRLRGERVERFGAKVTVLALGVVGWVAGPLIARAPGASVGSLSEYFTELGPRVARPATPGLIAAAEQMFRHAAALTGDLIAGLFVRLRYSFHQDIFVPVAELPSRSVSWIVGALVLAGVCFTIMRRLRTAADRILVSWIAVAIVPAIFSDHAYPKRSAMLFPALFVLAASAGARFLSIVERHGAWPRRVLRPLLGVAVALWFCATSWLWFSGVRWSAGVPNETLLVNRLRPQLTPGTIVIAKVWHGYAPGKLTYLFSDVLRDPSRLPLLWYVLTPERSLQSLIDDPSAAVTYAATDAFYYRWPGIAQSSYDPGRASGWSRVIYILQTGIDDEEQLRVRGVGKNDRLDREWLDVLQDTCGSAQVTIPPREDCDDCGYAVFACALRR
jgi:hypothetical protein